MANLSPGSDNGHFAASNQLLTVVEVASELRCSKAHICNLMNGKVGGASPLPCVRLGRRRLVRRESLEAWMKTNEH
jgi:excisionase family DNA binding protein